MSVLWHTMQLMQKALKLKAAAAAAAAAAERALLALLLLLSSFAFSARTHINKSMSSRAASRRVAA